MADELFSRAAMPSQRAEAPLATIRVRVSIHSASIELHADVIVFRLKGGDVRNMETRAEPLGPAISCS